MLPIQPSIPRESIIDQISLNTPSLTPTNPPRAHLLRSHSYPQPTMRAAVRAAASGQLSFDGSIAIARMLNHCESGHIALSQRDEGQGGG